MLTCLSFVAVILAFVGIALWVFVQINRDDVLSNLNGTKAGTIIWDKSDLKSTRAELCIGRGRSFFCDYSMCSVAKQVTTYLVKR
jgi:hypothetical protein